ncbi:MAG: TauD/TfdA family dioxygenase [Alphaproteobacteria bacterium]|nr:TauD/TfdA family dioxygenase [Alphaproteobacteria bacterium]
MNHVATAAAFTLEPVSPGIGAEIGGIDLREPLSAAARDGLYQALLDWKVLFFRDQDLTKEQHLAFAGAFGELEVHPFAASDRDHPEMLRLHHNAEHPGTENIWHSDVTWRLQPSLGSVLRSREAPPVGGDTVFADMGAAYRGLPEAIRERVTGLYARHDFAPFRARLKEKGASEAELAEFDRLYPHPEHPVIRTHPDTGEQAIYVNRAFTREILGVSAEESATLLEILYAQALYPEYQCRFRWKANSIAFWDNRACQHYAVSDYWPHTRVAERVTIIGDTPVYRASAEPVAGLDERFRGVLRRRSTGQAQPGTPLQENWMNRGA